MVKVGFIVEGGSESIIINSPQFKEFLTRHGCQLLSPVIDAKGGGNLLPKNIGVFLEQLQQQAADKIVVLTDLEMGPSVTVVRERIAHPQLDIIFVAVKALEAWYLADTDAMKRWLESADFFEKHPERTDGMPWDRLAEIAQELSQRGPGKNKVAFAKKIVKHHRFSIENAANHPDCPSAKEVVDYFAGEAV